MTSNFKFIKAGSVALFALTSALLAPLAFSQPSATPGNNAMPGGRAGAASMPGGMGMKEGQMPGKAGSSAMSGGMDMKAMMKTHNDKMASMQMMGNTDMDFAMMMRMHHQGAIDMSEAQLRDGKDPQMRKLAKDIIAAQKKEIAQLDKFLVKSGHPVEKMK